ncbi:hypothetical protein HQ520_05280 [bacterium]|nr:hypothetical protein [bacterium]
MAQWLSIAAVEIPETFEFLKAGWWIIHLIAVPAIFAIGFGLGASRGRKDFGEKSDRQ